MKSPRLILAMAIGLIATATFADTAKVNGVAIPDSRMDAIVKEVVSQGAKDSPELRSQIREQLIANEVVYQAAIAQGLDKKPEVQQTIDMAKYQIVSSAFVEDYLKNNPVSDADIKKKYDEVIQASFSGKEYKVRHILVKTENEAKTILADLKKGKKFDDLAKQKSIDKISGAQGGDLGWAAPGNFVPEFDAALTKLAKGQITDTPVKTENGFHIIKVEDTRDRQKPQLDEIKPNLQRLLQQGQIQKLVEGLRAKAKVE